MKMLPFKRPTDHYNEEIKEIDEKLCSLIQVRKQKSNGDPGFPSLDYISDWAEKYEVYEDLLRSVFMTLWNEQLYRPFVEPNEFRMHIPVLKHVEIQNRIYSVTFIRQYNNASIVNFNIDWDCETHDDRTNHSRSINNSHFELTLGKNYDCRMKRGSGSEGHFQYNFVVSPPLPDNVSGIELVFKECNIPYTENAAGEKIEIRINL